MVEIGPGRGFLTTSLASVAGRLVAVELDDVLAAVLATAFEGQPNVEVVRADARDADIDSLVTPGVPYKMVANLPYYAASPIVRRFLEADRKPTLIVVMLQREVARQMAAAPGKMSLLSVATQLYGEVRIVTHVPPRAFRPAPKVTSAVVRIDVFSDPALELDSAGEFFRVVRAGFSAPRKQLRNSLSQGLDLPAVEAQELLARASIDSTRRPQTLSIAEWGRLYEASRSHIERVDG